MIEENDRSEEAIQAEADRLRRERDEAKAEVERERLNRGNAEQEVIDLRAEVKRLQPNAECPCCASGTINDDDAMTSQIAAIQAERDHLREHVAALEATREQNIERIGELSRKTCRFEDESDRLRREIEVSQRVIDTISAYNPESMQKDIDRLRQEKEQWVNCATGLKHRAEEAEERVKELEAEREEAIIRCELAEGAALELQDALDRLLDWAAGQPCENEIDTAGTGLLNCFQRGIPDEHLCQPCQAREALKGDTDAD